MNENELTSRILSSFGHTPTSDQLSAVKVFSAFMFSASPRAAMVLTGSAGTGKTSLASAMVKTLAGLGAKTVLMAPTGRAAKVFSLGAGAEAHTIHRKIYRQRTFDGLDTNFGLGENRLKKTLFIVDEASMISNKSASGRDLFGSGCLLDDLIQYVYSGQGCRLMLIGDRAQLPPVGLKDSPALDSSVLASRGLEVTAANMDEVLRQSSESGILFNATAIRRTVLSGGKPVPPRIRLAGFPDVRAVNGDELIESICGSYSKAGIDGTMIVTRSNKRAIVYNQGIRGMILGREEGLTSGDRVMVVKNNYFWTAKDQAEAVRNQEPEVREIPSFLANGDTAVVRRARRFREVHGFRFADVTLSFPDYDFYETDATVMLDSLASEAPSLTQEENTRLFNSVLEDYAHIKSRRKRMQAVREDVYYNALQIKFAYAVTCHKAQGGQWEHVYIDQGYLTEKMIDGDYIHWLYTAFTRATEKLFLVNWPRVQKEEPEASE